MSRKAKKQTDDMIDRMVAAYIAEASRWSWRRVRMPVGQNDRFVLDYDGGADRKAATIKLTARECKTHHDAEGWLNTYSSRAGMRAALAVAG